MAAYPPYNVELVDENHYRIAIAVAGFAESELEITAGILNLLVVKALMRTSRNVLTCIRALPSVTLSVSSVSGKHSRSRQNCGVTGLLYIGHGRVIPEANKPHRIEINALIPSGRVALTCHPMLAVRGIFARKV